MAFNVFATDPEAKKNQKPKYEHPAFQFRSGMLRGRRPVSLPTWRVITGDRDIAAAVAQLFGGAVEEYDPTKEDNLHVVTDADSVEIVIDGVDSIDDRAQLWGGNGKLIHECNFETFLSPPEKAGNPCGCPSTVKALKAAHREGTGPGPVIKVTFRLAEDYDLGKGVLQVSAWGLAEVLHVVRNDLDAVGEPALCKLRLDLVKFTAKDGTNVEYRKPVIEVLGSYNDAIAQERG